ncbi:Zinc finger protein 862 [Dissostichus eleginoides]|uniref:Zinc finger protein 862 n=1 Tax=Dissostichus eleginoides TaxID=100907 RepID=A0AAD9FB61_DISEL|nr:Zinc finger protein 862 [Dissostichus eleginoides]
MSWLQAPKANQAPGKRPRRDPEKSAASKLDYETKRKRNFLPSWTEKFPWLRYTEEAGEEYMMYCSTCRSLPDIADTETFTQHGQEEMKSLSGFYKELLAKAGITPEEVIAEYAQYKSFALRRSAVPMRDIFLSVLQSEERRAMFRCLCHLMEIYMVLPVSTAVCERGFSTMKRVKTDWRSSLTTAQLQRLMFISIQGPALEDFDAASAAQRWWTSSLRRRRPGFNPWSSRERGDEEDELVLMGSEDAFFAVQPIHF